MRRGGALCPRPPALVQPGIGLGVVVALALLAFLVGVVAVVVSVVAVVGTVVGTVVVGVGLGVDSPALGATSPAGSLPGQRARGQSRQQRRRQP